MTSLLILQGELSEYRRPLFNALSEHYCVTVLHGGRSARLESDGFAEHVLTQRCVGPFHIQDVNMVRRVMGEHDVTVAMFDLRWPAYCLPVLDRRRPPFLFHGHRYSGRRLTDAVRNRLMKRANGLIMYGEDEIPRMIASGIDLGLINVAPNTVYVPNHEDLSDRPKKSLLYVGRLQDRKRLNIAIRAFGQLQGRIDPAIVFNVIGAGEPQAALRQCADDSGVADKVLFHGAIHDPERLKSFFEVAIAYVSPGPVGLAVLHSFAFGVPVLTLAEGRHGPEFHNIAHGRNGLILRDAQEYEDALLWLCTESSFAADLGREAYRHYASSRTLDHMVAGYRNAIEKARA